MQRCAATFVLLINIHALLLEIVQGDRGIPLSRHMKHVQTELVHSMRVRTIGDQSHHCVHVSFEGGQVQGRELIRGRARVDPSFDLVKRDFLSLLYRLYQH